jgi:glycine/D-amino acid oxidase-like deaminating enzyme
MVSVAVVGAGIVGAAVAYRLAASGATVHLIDRALPGAGTTSASYAWVNANEKEPRAYFALNRAGMVEHRRLAEGLAPADWYHPDGNLIWLDGARRGELTARVERLRAWGYAATWLSGREVNAGLEPGIAFPDPATPVAFFPEEAWVDAPRLVDRLVKEARHNGATLRLGQSVTGIDLRGGRVAAVVLADGERIGVEAVVNAAGPGADRVAALVGRRLPLAPVAGLVVRLAVAGTPIGRSLETPRLLLRPDGAGFVVVRQEDLDDELRGRLAITPDDPICREAIARAGAVVPALAEARVVAARAGVRPIPADGVSCVGAVAAIPGYYEAVTHSGVTLGPLLGRLLTAEVLKGEVAPLLAPFRPARFDPAT